jgi:hypothetical protein
MAIEYDGRQQWLEFAAASQHRRCNVSERCKLFDLLRSIASAIAAEWQCDGHTSSASERFAAMASASLAHTNSIFFSLFLSHSQLYAFVTPIVSLQVYHS